MTDEPETRHLHGSHIHGHPGGDVRHDHPDSPWLRPGGGSGGHPVLAILGIILVSLVSLGTATSFFDPHLNFPVVSQVVCSLKGDTWYGGGILGEPGCYAPPSP